LLIFYLNWSPLFGDFRNFIKVFPVTISKGKESDSAKTDRNSLHDDCFYLSIGMQDGKRCNGNDFFLSFVFTPVKSVLGFPKKQSPPYREKAALLYSTELGPV